jgi:ketosteroid isomerase-like protein
MSEKTISDDEVQAWLNRYVEAWRANDPALIGALFSEDAAYHGDPFDDGLHGRQPIIDEWLREEMPRTFRADYRPVLVQGNQALATGYTEYFNEDGSRHSRWGNAFLLTFDGEGRCREYREWFMKARQ